MKLLLFLGSGVSVPSGLPLVREITDAVVYGSWTRHTDLLFYPGEPESKQQRDPTPTLQRFLRFLKAYADAYYALRNGQETTYEDLFYLAHQLSEDARGAVDNPAIQGYIDEVRRRTRGFVDEVGDLGTSDRFLGMVWAAEELIQCVVRHKLLGAKQIKGLDLIAELALDGSLERLDIATLNHDLLVESFLLQRNISFADGFGSQKGDIRYFDPGAFEHAPKVRLFKLHGSVNWFRFRKCSEGVEQDVYASTATADGWRCKDEQGRLLRNLSATPLFLAGTYNKPAQYGLGVFAEMHFWFHRLLKEHGTIAMSGYGWNDSGINSRFWGWLDASKRNRILLMHTSPREMAAKSKSPLFGLYDGLVTRKQVVPINKWMADVSASEILGIQILNSPAPGEAR